MKTGTLFSLMLLCILVLNCSTSAGQQGTPKSHLTGWSGDSTLSNLKTLQETASDIRVDPKRNMKNKALMESGPAKHSGLAYPQKVRSILEKRMTYRKGQASDSTEHRFYYNWQGLLLLSSYKQPKGFQRESSLIYEYDINGNLIKKIYAGYLSPILINGVPVDEAGEVIPFGSLIRRFNETIYTYDAQHRLVEEFRDNDDYTDFSVVKYPEKGLATTIRYIDSTPQNKGDIGVIDSLRFDKNGNLIYETYNYYAGEEIREIRRRTYNENDLVVRLIDFHEYSREKPDSIVFNYSNNMEMTSKTHFAENGSIYITNVEYKFDENRNWTEATFYRNKRLDRKVIRTISYFD